MTHWDSFQLFGKWGYNRESLRQFILPLQHQYIAVYQAQTTMNQNPLGRMNLQNAPGAVTAVDSDTMMNRRGSLRSLWTAAGRGGESSLEHHSSVVDGSTPLHLAASRCRDVGEIQKLLLQWSSADPASIKDKNGRCPLHMACASLMGGAFNGIPKRLKGKLLRRLSNSEGEPDTRFQVIKLLVAAYPRALVIRDSNGMTPLDLAVANKASIKIVDYLMTAIKMHGFNSSMPSLAGSHTTNSTVCGIPFEVSFSTLPLPDEDEDDLSSVGWDGGGIYNPDGTLNGVDPRNIVRDPNSNSNEVIERCWFL